VRANKQRYNEQLTTLKQQLLEKATERTEQIATGESPSVQTGEVLALLRTMYADLQAIIDAQDTFVLPDFLQELRILQNLILFKDVVRLMFFSHGSKTEDQEQPKGIIVEEGELALDTARKNHRMLIAKTLSSFGMQNTAQGAPGHAPTKPLSLETFSARWAIHQASIVGESSAHGKEWMNEDGKQWFAAFTEHEVREVCSYAYNISFRIMYEAFAQEISERYPHGITQKEHLQEWTRCLSRACNTCLFSFTVEISGKAMLFRPLDFSFIAKIAQGKIGALRKELVNEFFENDETTQTSPQKQSTQEMNPSMDIRKEEDDGTIAQSPASSEQEQIVRTLRKKLDDKRVELNQVEEVCKERRYLIKKQTGELLCDILDHIVGQELAKHGIDQEELVVVDQLLRAGKKIRDTTQQVEAFQQANKQYGNLSLQLEDIKQRRDECSSIIGTLTSLRDEILSKIEALFYERIVPAVQNGTVSSSLEAVQTSGKQLIVACIEWERDQEEILHPLLEEIVALETEYEHCAQKHPTNES
jgi:hypothetical protein